MDNKGRLIAILAVLALIVGLVIYGMMSSSSRSAASTAALQAQTGAQQQPGQTDADRAAASTALSVVTNPQDDRVRVGAKLPFAIPMGGAVETEAGKLLSANITLGSGESGTLEDLAPQDGKVWVMIEMEPSNKKSLLGKSVARAMEVVQPLMQDSQGQYYEPCGLIYKDMGQKVINLDPMNVIRGLSQAPRLEESRSDQALWLVFLVPPGTEVQAFYLGKKKMVEWVPGVAVK
ncbi:MAG: hypothetical protein U0637_14125 [Phycisphaerales bacterium]